MYHFCKFGPAINLWARFKIITGRVYEGFFEICVLSKTHLNNGKTERTDATKNYEVLS